MLPDMENGNGIKNAPCRLWTHYGWPLYSAFHGTWLSLVERCTGGAEVASSNLVVPNFLSGLLDTGPDTDLECQRHGCQTEFPIINLGQIPGMLADRWTRALANSVGVYSAATASASCPLVRKFVCRVDLNIS